MSTHPKPKPSEPIGTVALIVYSKHEKELRFIEATSNDQEIQFFEEMFTRGESDPISLLYDMREELKRQDDEFGDYVEELLTRPFVRPEVRQHGIDWMRSRMKIEGFHNQENDATQVIAKYAYDIFLQDPNRKDFLLAGPKARVRVKVFVVDELSLDVKKCA
jgi:hypothetical protein